MAFFREEITKDQSKDTGMAMVLLLLLVFLSRKREGYLFAAMGLHVLNMIVPKIFRPVAFLWFAISDLMGAVMSKVLLSIVFFGVVIPIAVVRRILGKDSLQLQGFKASKGSVMLVRDHTFVAADLERPY